MSARVFLDTVGLIALWDSADQWHGVAKEAYARIDDLKPQYFTTSYVLLECGNAAARRPFRGAPDRLRQVIERSKRLIHADSSDWDAAWLAYRNGEGNRAGIVDQFSFLAMRRLGIDLAFTNDAHFRAAGFQVLF